MSFLEICSQGDKERVLKCIHENEEVLWTRQEDGTSPLHVAAASGSLDVVKALISAGHPWNAIDNHNTTAAETAQQHNHTHIYDFIVEEGVRTELVLNALAAHDPDTATPNADYLSQKLRYVGDKLLDHDNNGVMMGWESPLMRRHAEWLLPTPGLDILNVGFGLGLFDTYAQTHDPRTHTIIEAHPDVYAHMLSLSWDKKPGVTILFGRWQDVLDQLESYDAIYFDTYGEFYKDMQDWHEHVTNILRQDGRYSFFNGLAATNPVFHKVSCRVAELELSALGLNVEWEEMHMDPKEESVWEGVRARYWKLDTYWFPLCRFADY